jgi:hypothetical protein
VILCIYVFFTVVLLQGEHARYSVEIVDTTPPEAGSAFYISPLEGYQRQNFFVGTTNHSMLDYEVSEFQHVVLRVRILNNFCTYEYTNEELYGSAVNALRRATAEIKQRCSVIG